MSNNSFNPCFHPFKYSEIELRMPITKQTRHLVQSSKLRYVPVYVCFRRGLKQCIKNLSEYYDVFVWTSAIAEYAKCILDHVDCWDYI